ncbi:Pr6Pr family membrane protein [Nesterenkonia sphaerica]|uniref:F420-dependent oxidoreductase n=1 Tax=Nesterenkonia sphaerica TaxID=1804988 RepID=A0A5R9ALW4_9MICC|nr:Pr6Pr family membrane protein [Nesterenkonia sphaerica]TLP78975.1 hypothetical protein FEF27_03740 [Nesterenkonia sphaerica]
MPTSKSTSDALSWQYSAAARCVHAAVAALCAAGLLSSLYLGWTTASQLPPGVGYSGGFAAGWPHLLNQPAYFTFLSALLVCVTSVQLSLRPHRTSAVFHSVRLAGTVQVVITGVVFNLLLRTEGELAGIWLFHDQVLHVAVPILAPLVWLVLGPHGHLTGRVVAGSTVLPLLWLAVTLLRGPVLDWYPYTILDVPGMGLGAVAPYVGAILIGFLALASGMWLIDRLRWGSRRSH